VSATDTVVLDCSVVVALFKRETDAQALFDRLSRFDKRKISAANFFEAAIVCEEWGEPAGPEEFDRLVAMLRLEIVPTTHRQAELAREVHRRFGTRRGDPAVLNFGDCFAYALAKDLGAPLLFKGGDFVHTDVERA
jgi:ribonuclease VapC